MEKKCHFLFRLPAVVQEKVFGLLSPKDLLSFHQSSRTASRIIPNHLLSEVFLHIQFHNFPSFNVTSVKGVSTTAFSFINYQSMADAFPKRTIRQFDVSAEKLEINTDFILSVMSRMNSQDLDVFKVVPCNERNWPNGYEVYLLQPILFRMRTKKLVMDVKFRTDDDKFLDMYGTRHVIANKGIAEPLNTFKALRTECLYLTVKTFHFDDSTFPEYIAKWKNDDSPYWIMKGLETDEYRPAILRDWKGTMTLLGGTVVTPTKLKEIEFEDRKIPVVNGFDVKSNVEGRTATFMSTKDNFYVIFTHTPVEVTHEFDMFEGFSFLPPTWLL